MRRFVVLVVLMAVAWTYPPTASAQPLVDRVEKQVRKQLETPMAEPAKNKPAPARSARDAAAAPEKRLTERGYLGALADDRDDRGRGVRILRLTPSGPAERAGLRAGDLITGVGGVRVREMTDFAAILDQVPAGLLLTFEVLRPTGPQKVDVTFGQRPANKITPAVPGAIPPPGSVPEAVREEPGVAVPLSTEPGVAPIRRPPTPTPTPAKVKPSRDDQARIALLEQRVRELETRLEQLERTLRGKESPPRK